MCMVYGFKIEDVACSIGFDLYSSQHQEGLRPHMNGVLVSAMSIFSGPSLSME